jgi:hypothetical protein
MSLNIEIFEKGSEAYDANGNSVMHLAYYYQRDAMAKLLEENRFNDKLKI